jgi:hypothetical protein
MMPAVTRAAIYAPCRVPYRRPIHLACRPPDAKTLRRKGPRGNRCARTITAVVELSQRSEECESAPKRDPSQTAATN